MCMSNGQSVICTNLLSDIQLSTEEDLHSMVLVDSCLETGLSGSCLQLLHVVFMVSGWHHEFITGLYTR